MLNFMDIGTIEFILRYHVNSRIDIYKNGFSIHTMAKNTLKKIVFKKISLKLHNICLRKTVQLCRLFQSF